MFDVQCLARGCCIVLGLIVGQLFWLARLLCRCTGLIQMNEGGAAFFSRGSSRSHGLAWTMSLECSVLCTVRGELSCFAVNWKSDGLCFVTLGAAAPSTPCLVLHSSCYIFTITIKAASNLSVCIHLELLLHLWWPKQHLLLNHETFMESQIPLFPGCHACENKQVHYHTRHQREAENSQFYSRMNTLVWWRPLIVTAQTASVEEGKCLLTFLSV